MMAEGGQNTFRFSVSWSRIIPDESHMVNKEGLAFYDKVLDTCEIYGIIPNVTLVHYDLPDYIGAKGGWCYEGIADEFAFYASVVFKHFGNRIPFYVTINEPSHNAYCCYLVGNYPPNEINIQHYFQCVYNMVVCNAKAIREFRKLHLKSQIGIVHASGSAEALKDTKDYQEAVKYADMFSNDWVLDPAIKGYFEEELIKKVKDSGIDLSFVKQDDLAVIKENTVDFLGQNAYCRILVKPYVSGETRATVNNAGSLSAVREGKVIKGWFESDYDPNVKLNPWGREIYPKCIYNTLINRKKRYGDIPIYITENGHGCYDVPDENGYVEDDERIQFLDEFIKYILKAKESGVNVKGYYVWSTMDLYSWINGYKKRYGLVRVDYDSKDLKRIPKKSYYWYRDFIKDYENI
jgi:Beta-glucosidase/6-phospho-beta-glucosidase/beta-galactosidase